MNTNINLFAVIDSKEQYDKFIKLATEDYTELENQIKNHFQLGQEEGLREYKVNILAEHAYKENDIGIINNIFWGIFFPSLISLLTISIFPRLQENSSIIPSIISYVAGALTIVLVIMYLQNYHKFNSKRRKQIINQNKAIVFLENFEIN
ncbi:hypothetical protein [Streptococcus oralis]|uniref:hypothetical protein n=1 Tax=Streptococcus oralis TaxID=1303 RepID=UPI000777EA34|nr:hypothetical protein [Streptococcus oralis]